MEKENKYGKTTPYIRAIGRIIKPMAEADLSTRMVMYMKVNG